MQTAIITKTQFTDSVMAHYAGQSETCKSYIDSCVSICQKLKIDVEDIKTFASDSLMEYIRVEASKNNLIKEKSVTSALF